MVVAEFQDVFRVVRVGAGACRPWRDLPGFGSRVPRALKRWAIFFHPFGMGAVAELRVEGRVMANGGWQMANGGTSESVRFELVN